MSSPLPLLQNRRKVMIAVDGSEAATQAMLWAVREAVAPSDEVRLVSVAPPASHTVSLVPAAHGATTPRGGVQERCMQRC